MKMKKLLIIAFFATGVFALNALHAAEKPVTKKGVLAGFSSNNIGGGDNEILGASPDARNHVAIGGYMVQKLRSDLKLRLDILLTQKGGSYDYDGNKMNINLTYLQEDVLALYKLPLPIKQSVYLMGGGSVAVNLLSSAEVVVNGESDSTDMSDSTNTFDVGLVIGAGIEATDQIFVDARYNFSLLSFDSGNADMTNNGFFLTAGYTF